MNIWGFLSQYGPDMLVVGGYLILSGGYYHMNYKISYLMKENDINKDAIKKTDESLNKHYIELSEHMSSIAESVARIEGYMKAKQK